MNLSDSRLDRTRIRFGLVKQRKTFFQRVLKPYLLQNCWKNSNQHVQQSLEFVYKIHQTIGSQVSKFILNLTFFNPPKQIIEKEILWRLLQFMFWKFRNSVWNKFLEKFIFQTTIGAKSSDGVGSIVSPSGKPLPLPPLCSTSVWGVGSWKSSPNSLMNHWVNSWLLWSMDPSSPTAKVNYPTLRKKSHERFSEFLKTVEQVYPRQILSFPKFLNFFGRIENFVFWEFKSWKEKNKLH